MIVAISIVFALASVAIGSTVTAAPSAEQDRLDPLKSSRIVQAERYRFDQQTAVDAGLAAGAALAQNSADKVPPGDAVQSQSEASEADVSSGNKTAEDTILKGAPSENNTQEDMPDVEKPADLVGLAPEQAAGMFGEPTQEILAAPARIWQYNATICTLRLIFYRDILTERYRALSYEIRLAEQGDKNAERRCLASIIADKSG